jgi:hypothetical protein
MLTIIGFLFIFSYHRYINNAYEEYDIKIRDILVDVLNSEIHEELSVANSLGFIGSHTLKTDKLYNYSMILYNRTNIYNTFDLVLTSDPAGIIELCFFKDPKDNLLHFEESNIESHVIKVNKIIKEKLNVSNNYTTTGYMWSDTRNALYLLNVSPIYGDVAVRYPTGFLFLGKRIDVIGNLITNRNPNIHLKWNLSKITSEDVIKNNTNKQTYYYHDDIFGDKTIELELKNWNDYGDKKRIESAITISVIIIFYMIILFLGNLFILNNFDNKLITIMYELDAIEDSKFVKHSISFNHENDELYSIVNRINKIFKETINKFIKFNQRQDNK